jgi:deoxyribodipyrimidine photo-lyase
LFGKRLTSLAEMENSAVFASWCKGKTGQPFIDAGMNELRQTGWLSNRMRQNAASYLVHDLDLDWRWGALWFERYLIDYDPCSNWGNWSYIAGARPGEPPHIFDVEQQARHYDPNDAYVRIWSAQGASS